VILRWRIVPDIWLARLTGSWFLVVLIPRRRWLKR